MPHSLKSMKVFTHSNHLSNSEVIAMSDTDPGMKEYMEGKEGGTQWELILPLSGVGLVFLSIITYCICKTSTRDNRDNT